MFIKLLYIGQCYLHFKSVLHPIITKTKMCVCVIIATPNFLRLENLYRSISCFFQVLLFIYCSMHCKSMTLFKISKQSFFLFHILVRGYSIFTNWFVSFKKSPPIYIARFNRGVLKVRRKGQIDKVQLFSEQYCITHGKPNTPLHLRGGRYYGL